MTLDNLNEIEKLKLMIKRVKQLIREFDEGQMQLLSMLKAMEKQLEILEQINYRENDT